MIQNSCDVFPIVAGHLRKSEVQSLRMEEYCERVASTYCSGTFRTGPLQQVSLVGQVAEESGGYLSDVLGKLCFQYPPSISSDLCQYLVSLCQYLVSPLTSPGPADLLEQSPFLSTAMPWGSLSALNLASRSHSDDGPILWVRPGEQLIPTAELGGPGTPRKRRM